MTNHYGRNQFFNIYFRCQCNTHLNFTFTWISAVFLCFNIMSKYFHYRYIMCDISCYKFTDKIALILFYKCLLYWHPVSMLFSVHIFVKRKHDIPVMKILRRIWSGVLVWVAGTSPLWMRLSDVWWARSGIWSFDYRMISLSGWSRLTDGPSGDQDHDLA